MRHRCGRPACFVAGWLATISFLGHVDHRSSRTSMSFEDARQPDKVSKFNARILTAGQRKKQALTASSMPSARRPRAKDKAVGSSDEKQPRGGQPGGPRDRAAGTIQAASQAGRKTGRRAVRERAIESAAGRSVAFRKIDKYWAMMIMQAFYVIDRRRPCMLPAGLPPLTAACCALRNFPHHVPSPPPLLAPSRRRRRRPLPRRSSRISLR